MNGLRLALTIAAAALAAGALMDPAAADGMGRAASTPGLVNAAGKVNLQDISFDRPMESLSLNFTRANDPEQPGVTPGDGGIEP